MENQIVMIDINKLHPHPNNPRKDLGDLSELTESIRQNGILQNLTVVPATGYYDGDYTVIIGHRRLAAALLIAEQSAGARLAELPCVVREMSKKDQLSAMLIENMQRTDLTVYEQAQHMQLMLDLGETVETVAERTGFSESTVRRRIKLAKLDADTLRDTAEKARDDGKQITLGEYEELFKIEDEAARNEALKSIGTDKFESKIRDELWKQEQAEKERKYKAALQDYAEEIDNVVDFKYVGFAMTAERVKEITDENPSAKLYYYPKKYGGAEFYRDYTDEERAETEQFRAARKREEEEFATRRANREQLKAIGAKLFDFRANYVKQVVNRSTDLPVELTNSVMDFAAWLFSPNQWWIVQAEQDLDDELFYRITGIEYNEDITPDDVCDEATERYSPAKRLLIYAYCVSGDNKEQACCNWDCEYIANERLSRIYKLLGWLGYSMSDEETAFLDGTHELYTGAADEN